MEEFKEKTFCYTCYWDNLSQLCQKKCLHGTHQLTTIVYFEKDLKKCFIIRIPLTSMSALKPVHSPGSCYDIRICDSPHSEVESKIWEVWIKSGILIKQQNPVSIIEFVTLDMLYN